MATRKVSRPKRITARQRAARRKNIEIARRHRRKASRAFKKEYKKVKSDKFVSKSYARRRGHTAAIKSNKAKGSKLARKFATAKARSLGYDAKGARQFAKGYVRSILQDIRRGA